MASEEKLRELIEELDRLHPNGVVDPKAWDDLAGGDGLPNFVTAASGYERHFSKKAQAALRDLAAIRYESDRSISSVMRIQQFGQLVRHCVADLHAAGLLTLNLIEEAHSRLNEEIRSRLSQIPLTFTHYFPGWTLGMESERPFVLGPVTFMTIEQWIDSVDFAPETIRRYLNQPEANARWKESLRSLLARSHTTTDSEVAPQPSLARTAYSAIRDYSSLMKVTVSGYEFHLSQKVGEIVCKSGLDAVSLLFGGKEYFYQQALAHEHLPPMRSSSIVEMDGHLLLPGTTWGPRFRMVSYPAVREYLANNVAAIDALGNILTALVSPDSASHPNLAKRWSTALDWYAEGQRERNDAVALTKIATSLDVLACGGKFSGILQMLTTLLSLDETHVVVKGRAPLSLKQVVKIIYDKGRSQILHGTEFDRIKSFETSRSHAAVLARLALLMAATRLKTYSGLDEDHAFRSMPP